MDHNRGHRKGLGNPSSHGTTSLLTPSSSRGTRLNRTAIINHTTTEGTTTLADTEEITTTTITTTTQDTVEITTTTTIGAEQIRRIISSLQTLREEYTS